MASGIVESQNSDSSQQSSQSSGSRSKLVQRLLASGANLQQFLHDLLTTQAVVVAGTEAAGFIIEKKDGEPVLRTIAHIRPDNSSAETRAAAITAFQDILRPCITQGKDGAIEINTGDVAPEPQFCLVTLLRTDGEIVAASAVITRCRNLERAQQRLMSMQLVAGYFELFSLRRTSEQSQIVAQSHQHVLQLATAVATAEGFESAAMNLCNELATRTGSTRVALGWLKGNDVRVKALSHTEEFDKKQQLIRTLEEVMEECIDQEEPVHFDPDGEGTQNVSRSAQALSRSEGGNIVLTLPLRRRADVIGAITLEFPSTQKLSPQAATGLSVAVDLLAPQLYDRYQNDRWLVTKAGLSMRGMAEKAVGPQHMLIKGIILLCIAAVVLLVVIRPVYHIGGAFTFDSINKQKLEVPFEGVIAKVNFEAGDHVKKGDVLLVMDTSEIEQEKNASDARATEARMAYIADNADPDPAKKALAAVDDAKRKEAEAESAKWQNYIDRAKVVAPFDGQIIKGDLKDEVLTPKKLGDELFTVAADGSLRAVMTVSERDIQSVHPGQLGSLATTSDPLKKYSLLVERIPPLGTAKEGDNVFTVYATMENQSPDWLPGLGGEARLDVGRRSIGWIWTHKLVDYLRLKLWM